MNIALEKNRYFIESLLENELFKELPYQSLMRLIEISAAEYWKKNTSLLAGNKTRYKFYIIISGKVKIYNVGSENKRQLTFFLLKDNDVFDAITLLDDLQHKIFYETLEDTVLLSIPIYKMRRWICNHPDVRTSLLLYLTKKIRSLESYVIDVSLESISTRLAKLLMRYMNPTSGKIELINNLSHDELAGLIGTTRAVLNRQIQDFKEVGVLRTKRKLIEVTDISLLKDYANNKQ